MFLEYNFECKNQPYKMSIESPMIIRFSRQYHDEDVRLPWFNFLTIRPCFRTIQSSEVAFEVCYCEQFGMGEYIYDEYNEHLSTANEIASAIYQRMHICIPKKYRDIIESTKVAFKLAMSR
jgi:hypothetical protein